MKNRTCYYLDDTMRSADIDFYKILLDEKSYEDILTYSILFKTFMDAKPLRIRFDKIDGGIQTLDGTRYLVLFGPEKYDVIYD